MKRLWPYLLLNVVISAATMLIVLLIWNATHGSASVAANGSIHDSNLSSITPQPTNTLPALDEKLFKIDSVIGSGDLETEYVHIVYLGENALDLNGWKVMNGKRTVFTFPAFLLYKGGAFDLYTKSGVNTAIDLFVNSKTPLWNNGDTINIVDPDGNTRLDYIIP